MTRFLTARRFTSLFVLLTWSASMPLAYGQHARLFSTDAHLSNSLINDIHQDHRGIIWIATEDRLNRYDGSKFSIYREKESGILNNYVCRIYEDSKHHLYFGFFNGLQKYDRATDSFTDIPLFLQDRTESRAHVLTVTERHDGTILIGTSGRGVFTLPSGADSAAYQLADPLPSHFISCLFEDADLNLWLATQDQGLFCIRAEGRTANYFDPGSGVGNDITEITQDQAGNIFVSSLTRGLFRYDAEKDTFRHIVHSGGNSASLSIQSLHPTDDGQLLIGTDGKGLKLYDPVNNEISSLNFNVSNFDFSKSKVHTIMQDKAGNYWLGLYQKGVVLIPARMNHFQYIGYQSVTSNIIGSNYIMSILEDHQGNLWVGTDSDGLYEITPDGQQVAHFAPPETDRSIPSTIMCMYEDSNSDLWIGSYLGGLSRLDRKTGRIRPVEKLLTGQSDPVRRVYSITEDSHDNLWIGTMGFGLYCMNLTTGEVTHYGGTSNPNTAHNSLHNSWIYSLMVSKDEKLYIGTSDGLASLDLNTRTFTTFNSRHACLRGQSIQTLHEDYRGNIWLGTTHGLMLLEPGSGKLKTLTMQDGLPSDVICAIESDEPHSLWISTHYGISKLNLNDTLFINYYFHDGLQGNEFSKRASFKDDQGRIFFGGINGITHFRPQEIKDQLKTLNVAVTGFYIQDQEVKKGMRSGKYHIVDTAVMDAETFHLSHEDNSFSIEFSAMEYVNPKRITFLYAMGNDDWISLQQGTNTVAFNNLEPGTYTFKVRAKDFTTFSEMKTLAITIHPAWYFSSRAKSGYLVIALLTLTGIAFQIRQRFRTRQKMREHLHTKQINEAKLEFFTNISHEIRTPLSLIINPLKKLISNDVDEHRQKAYSVMRRNSERILHLVNQLLDLRKLDKGKISLAFRETDMETFVKTTCEIFEEQLQAKGIRFEIRHEPGLPGTWIDPDYFDKAIQNVLSNAIKFTPPDEKIVLNMETGEKADRTGRRAPHLVITVTDSGIGLNENELERIFDRFYQASNNPAQHHHGTGIGLHLTRSILELHYGTIHAENNPDKAGCRFVMCIPLGKDHLDPAEIMESPAETAVHIPILSPLPPDEEDHSIRSKSKRRVLVVDDDEEVRNYICGELASSYHMMDSPNGKEALSWTLDHKPDLIISDVTMPEMDGITFCKKVKQNVNINHIPVILLTARSGEQDNLEGLGTGADAYISKPFNMEILRKTTENIIRNRELLKNNFSGNQLQDDKVRNVEMQSADEKLMQRIMEVINENISNPDLNVEMIAHEIGFSRVHLYRKLKEITNQSVRDLIRNIRLKQAAKLLATKSVNISEVAYATGFSNPSKFSTSFKELYGVSPKVFVERTQMEKTQEP